MSADGGNPFSEEDEEKETIDQRQTMNNRFREIYWLLFLRTLYLSVFEFYFMYDESCSHFFSGPVGLVIITVIFIVQSILAMYMSTSDEFGPQNPSNRRRFIWLNVMEGLVCSGTAANLHRAQKIDLIDVAMLNSCTGAFYLVHVAFFTAKLKLYHGLFGAVSGLLITISALVARLLFLPSDQHLLIIVGISTTSLLSCLWYSFETHFSFSLVRKLIVPSSSPGDDNSRAQTATASFVMMCLAYVNVWHVLLLRQQPSPSPKWAETEDRLLPRPENDAAENHVDFDA